MDFHLLFTGHARHTPERSALLIGTAAVLVLMGVALAGGGLWLVLLGGSWYYGIAGLALLVTAWWLRAGHGAALWAYTGLLAGTLVWSLWEVSLA